MTGFLARHERFDRVGSTNDVVRGWLADGTAEVCLAVADTQTAGRGRDGRGWVAPRGAALLLSLGFRPSWLEPDDVWRLAAVVSVAMAEAAEASVELPAESIRLKWPNDLVLESAAGAMPRKVAGVLGETAGLGTGDPRVVVGLGLNVDWAAADFPPGLSASMTSLREAAPECRPDAAAVLDAFLDRLEPRIDALRATGAFDAAAWADRQVTTGRTIRLEHGDRAEIVLAVGVDPRRGALLVADPAAPDGRRAVLVGDVTHVRVAEPIAGSV